MNARILRAAVSLLLALSWAAYSQNTEATGQTGAGAEATGTPSQPARAEQAPDAKAYSEANRISDPAEKIKALEKFKKEFPNSASHDSANQAILSTLVSKMPKETARIKAQADLTYKESAKDSQGRAASQIADTLLGGNVQLKVARSYAGKGLKALVLETYVKEQTANAEKRKQALPSREDLVKRFQQSRAPRLSSLGRIEAALGHDAAARELLEEARKALPTNAAINGSLGELAAKRGDTAAAIDLLVTARLSGRTASSTITALESVFKKTHNGSVDGLAAYLDSEYRRRFPNPLKVEHYQATAKRSGRLALAEIFTGAGCPPCVSVDLAFEAAMLRYSSSELVVLMYHMHIPRPDPISNPDAQTRAKFYAVNAVPTFAVDGKTTVGGGGRENTQETYSGRRGFNTDIEKELESPAEASLKLTAAITGGVVKVAVSVDGLKPDLKEAQLQIALAEKELTYSGENGVRFHPMAVRAMGGKDAAGFAVAAGGPATFTQDFDVAQVSAAAKTHLDDYESKGHRGEPFKFVEKMDRIDASNLAVVAFVQDPKTKRVLQAAIVDLSTPRDHTVTSK